MTPNPPNPERHHRAAPASTAGAPDPETQRSEASPQARGFGHSKRRVALELGFIVGAVVLLIVLVIWLAGSAAQALTPMIPLDVDRALGKQSWASLAPDDKRCTNPEVNAYVESVAAPLLSPLNAPFQFEFAVVEDETVNAFALPGGFVTVNMGLLNKASSGEEVAAVLAHEMIHVTRRHGTKRILRQLGGMVVIGALFGGTDIELPAYAMGGLVNNAYDRDQETEADTLGQGVLKQAGVDPGAMAEFFARLQAEGGTPPALLSTHPDPGDRAERAKAAASGFEATTRLPPPRGLSCR